MAAENPPEVTLPSGRTYGLLQPCAPPYGSNAVSFHGDGAGAGSVAFSEEAGASGTSCRWEAFPRADKFMLGAAEEALASTTASSIPHGRQRDAETTRVMARRKTVDASVGLHAASMKKL